MQEIKGILKYKLVCLNSVLALLAGFASASYSFFAPVFFILISNLYDIFGYHFTLIRRSTQLPEKIIIKAYRINQLLFDVLMLVLIGVLFGWIFSIAGTILKLFGLQDVLYYIFLQKEIPLKFTWLNWSPFGMIKGDLTKSEVIVQSLFGIMIAVILILIHFKVFVI